MKLPPIMQAEGLTLHSIEAKDRHTVMIFQTPDRSITTGFIRVNVTFTGTPVYHYSKYDPMTGTNTHYDGKYGDPEKDTAVDITGH
jgi:hypothetical protein